MIGKLISIKSNSNKVKNTQSFVKSKTSIHQAHQKTKHNLGSQFGFVFLEILKLPVLFVQLVLAFAWLAVSLAIAIAIFNIFF